MYSRSCENHLKCKNCFINSVPLDVYENSITSVCEPDDVFFTEGAGGGTDITHTIKDYLNNFEAFDRAYVFTDGCDNFTYLKSVCDKFNVYFIQGNRRVYERYNENSNIPNRWG